MLQALGARFFRFAPSPPGQMIAQDNELVFTTQVARELSIDRTLAWQYLRFGQIAGSRQVGGGWWAAPRSSVEAFKRTRAVRGRAGKPTPRAMPREKHPEKKTAT